MNQRPVTAETDPARTRGRVRARTLLWAAAALAVFAQLTAQSTSLQVERDGDLLGIAAPHLHFLTGAPLQQLHDGRSVAYVLSVALEVERGTSGGTRLTRRVVFSYDLWEERFSVAQVDEPKSSASHLTATAAEAWCLDLLTLPVRAAPAAGTFVVKFECRLRDEGTPPADAPSATTFTGLIDLLSRKAREAPPRWEAVSPRLRLADLKDKASR
jgi:hypothetical protein